jgi:hypothetical protein
MLTVMVQLTQQSGSPSAATVTAENIKGNVRKKVMLLQYEQKLKGANYNI